MLTVLPIGKTETIKKIQMGHWRKLHQLTYLQTFTYRQVKEKNAHLQEKKLWHKN